MQRKYHVDGSAPNNDQIFVFGSNLSGIHGAGAARAARVQYGAKLGIAEGLCGRSYAIPTVKAHITGPLPLYAVEYAVNTFLVFARQHPEIEFFVTRIGCGLAGFPDDEIAPMFQHAPMNCDLPITWQHLLEE